MTTRRSLPRRLAPAAALVLVSALAFALAAAPAAAQCTSGLFYGDLKAGFITHFTNSPVTAMPGYPKPSADSACPGWQELVVTIPIPANCTKAIILAEYEGKPTDWTLDLGNSPTNDGFAGDAGGNGGHNAEVWIKDQSMAIANASSDPTKIDNPILLQDVSLTDSSFKFVVSNQFVSWGQPYGFLQTPASQNLFAIPNNDVSPPNRNIYLGLNTVITGDASRSGCGVRTVLIRFE